MIRFFDNKLYRFIIDITNRYQAKCVITSEKPRFLKRVKFAIGIDKWTRKTDQVTI